MDAIRLLSANPLMQRVLQLDADLMLPYLTDRLGSTQRLVEQFLVAQIEAGHLDGSIRFGDAKTQARVVLLSTQSMVLSDEARDLRARLHVAAGRAGQTAGRSTEAVNTSLNAARRAADSQRHSAKSPTCS